MLLINILPMMTAEYVMSERLVTVTLINFDRFFLLTLSIRNGRGFRVVDMIAIFIIIHL